MKVFQLHADTHTLLSANSGTRWVFVWYKYPSCFLCMYMLMGIHISSYTYMLSFLYAHACVCTHTDEFLCSLHCGNADYKSNAQVQLYTKWISVCLT